MVRPEQMAHHDGAEATIAVGKGRTLENGQVMPLTVKAGDRVLFGKYAGTEIKIDGDEHLIMREDDILAILQ
ncbi:MAG: Chaperonin Cpn10 [Deltaproteobacteria bacterium]|nr:Chaperonin Cpn10 [Deltaproteobacteria bacterium]